MDRNLRILGTGSGLRSFGLTFVGPFAALYLHQVAGLAFLTIGLVLAGISVPPLLWSPFAGALADRIGRRPVLLASLYGEAACMGIVALGIHLRSVPVFVGAFGVAGMLGATAGPALSAYVADISVGSDRTLGFTWLRVGTNVGFASGVAAGGLVLGFLGFSDAALLSMALLLGGTTFVAATLAPFPYDRALPDWTVARGADRGDRWAGVRTVARDRLFVATSAAFALAVLVSSQWGATYALFAASGLHLSYAQIGFGFALNGVLVVVGQTATTQAVLGQRHTTIAIYGTVAYAVGFLLLGVAALVPAALYAIFLLATGVITLGENLIIIPISTLPSNLATPEAVGAYNGGFGTILGLGGLVATAVGGAALGAISSPLLLWTVLVAPTIPAALLLRSIGRRLPDRPNRA